MQPDMSEPKMFAAAMAVIEELKRHTSDAETASCILKAADAAFGGGFTLGVGDRLEVFRQPFEAASEVPLQSSVVP